MPPRLSPKPNHVRQVRYADLQRRPAASGLTLTQAEAKLRRHAGRVWETVVAGRCSACRSSAFTARMSRSHRVGAPARQGTPRRRVSRPSCPRTTFRPGATPGRVGLRLVLARRGDERRRRCHSEWSTRRASATTRRSSRRPQPRCARCSPGGSGRSGTGEASNEHITGDPWPDKAPATRACASASR